MHGVCKQILHHLIIQRHLPPGLEVQTDVRDPEEPREMVEFDCATPEELTINGENSTLTAAFSNSIAASNMLFTALEVSMPTNSSNRT
jgi:hypothetical protein